MWLLFGNNLIGTLFYLRGDTFRCFHMIIVPPHLTEIVQRYSGYIRTAPCRNLTVPVFSHDKSMYTSAVHSQMLSQMILQSGRIQHSSGTNYPFFRITGQFLRRVSQNIYRICNNQKNSFKISFCNFRNNRLENCNVLCTRSSRVSSGF